MPAYIIITPAHNEEAFIERTIHSMISQTLPPAKWIVVNDGSSDRTAEIVSRYCLQHNFIKLVNVERQAGRNFGRKVHAFNRGLAEIQHDFYAFVGNLDADISFEPEYFEKLLSEFPKDARLGIAGGMVSSCIDNEYISQEVAPDSVAGAVQLFRRSCFEEIGGYLTLPGGGIDAAAEIMARMKGWKVRTFPNLRVFEHRRTGSATARPLAARLREGYRFRSLGYGFVFYCFRCAYRLREKPKIVGSLVALLGYLGSLIKRDPIALPPNVVQYLRSEQRAKLARIFRSRALSLRRSDFLRD